MRPVFICVLLLNAFIAAAQEEEYHNWGQAYGFAPKEIRYVYADTANVRTAPNATAPLQDRLGPGDEVTIVTAGKLFAINSKLAPWCEVSYTKDGTLKKGWLWGGLISPRTLKKDGVLFLYGMKFSGASDTPSMVHIKALKHNSVIAHTSFEIVSSQTSAGSHDASVTETKGLAGLSCILYFTYSGEACAVPTIEQYIGWDGKRFVVFPQIYSEVDAGAYAIEQKYIFPADKGGKPAELRMREVIEQYDDGVKPVKTTVKNTRYRWNASTKKLHEM